MKPLLIVPVILYFRLAYLVLLVVMESNVTISFASKRFYLNIFSLSSKISETFSKIPSNRLLVETDSPFLAPIPMRGKKNEPSYIKYTVKKLAEIKNIDMAKMNNITTDNFDKLFFNK